MGMQPSPDQAMFKRMQATRVAGLADGRYNDSFDRRGRRYRYNESHLNPDYDEYIKDAGNRRRNQEIERRRAGAVRDNMLRERMEQKQRLYSGGVQ